MCCCLCYVQDNDSDENYEEVDPEESENYIPAVTETQSAEEQDNEECYECFDGNFELPRSPHILKPPQTYQNITDSPVCVFVYVEPVHDPPPVERTSKRPNRALPRVKHSPPEPFRPPPSHCKFTYS